MGDLTAVELVAAEEAYLGTRIRALLELLADRDASTEEHTRRVALLAARVAEELKLPACLRRDLAVGGLLHDVGKLSVPLEILQKPGPLDDAEFAEIRRHPNAGRKLLDELGGFPETVRRLVSDHHERLDGTGYPNGLKGDELPIETRILAVCDVYDALVSDRVYRAAWTPERALGLLQEEAGTGYDPAVVSALERIVTPTDDSPSWVAGLAAPARRPAAPRRRVQARLTTESTHGPAAWRRSWTAHRYLFDSGGGTMANMTDLVTTARRKGTGELLLTSGLIVLYTSLRGTARALGAIEHVVAR